MQNQNDDLEKLQFYMNASFEASEGVLFSNLVKKPSHTELKEMLVTIGKCELEQLYNHFHMNAISENFCRQREYAELLWKEWRSKLSSQFPNKKTVIEINDNGQEIILYIFEEVQKG